MPAQLPVEIIGRVIQALYGSSTKHSPNALLPLLYVSPTFRAEAERLIYAHLHLRTLKQIVRCFTTLKRRPALAKFTRSLSVSVSLNSAEPFALWQMLGLGPQAASVNLRKTRHLGRVIKPFGDLVTPTLRTMTNLQDYSLSLGGQPGRTEVVYAPCWIPSDAPFKLKRFNTDLNLSFYMASFLISQSSISDLLAPYFQPQRAPIPTNALPLLKSVVTNSPMASVLVPKRPVRRVAVKDSSRTIDATLAPIIATLPQLAKASASVRHFDAAVFDMTSVAEVLWDSLSDQLPRLDTITLRRLLITNEDVYDLYLSNEFTTPLAKFSKLKHLVVPAPDRNHHLREAGLLPTFTLGGAGVTIHANIQAQVGPGGGPAPQWGDAIGNAIGNALGNLFGNANGPPMFGPPPAPGGGGGGGAGPPPPPPASDQADDGEDEEMPELVPIPLEDAAGNGGVANAAGGGQQFFGFHFGPAPPPPPAPVPAGHPAGPAPQPPAGPAPAAAQAPPANPGLPPFLQQLINMNGQGFMNIQLGNNGNGPQGGAGGGVGMWGGNMGQPPQFGPAPQPVPAPVPGHQANAPPPWVVGETIIIQGALLPPGLANGPQNNAPVAGPPPPPPAPGANNAPIGPAAVGAGAPAQNGQALVDGLQGIGAQIMNMIAQTQVNMTHLQQELAQTQADLAQIQTELQTLENGVFGPGGAAANAAAAGPPAVGNAGGAPAPALPQPVGTAGPLPLPVWHPLPAPNGAMQFDDPFPFPQIQANDADFLGVLDPLADDETMMPQASSRRQKLDPKAEEVLEKAQRDLKGKEKAILEKWKTYVPGLKTVSFDMDPRRRTLWTWKEDKRNVSVTGTAGESDNEEGHESGHRATGRWEVEYTKRA